VIIYLMRHGIAAPCAPGESDENRPLTDEGRALLREQARGFWNLKPKVDQIFASPLRRARETADLMAAGWPHRELRVEPPPITITSSLAPPARWEALVMQMRETTEAGALVIGHEPTMSAWVGALCFDEPGCGLFKPGTIAAIDLGDPRRLLWIMPPEMLRQIW
jgi:phosphohistidine phosphatase